MTAAAEEEAAPGYEFDDDFQIKIGAMTMRDTVFAQRTDGLIRPEFFENAADAVIASVALDFFKKYKKAPDKSSIKMILKDAIDSKRIRKDMIPDVKARMQKILLCDLSDRDLVIDKVVDFAKHRSMENAIMASVSLLQSGKFADIEKMIRAAVDVGVAEDSDDYDYFDEIESRTEYRHALDMGLIKPDGITTGIPELDKHLYHGGWGRKELTAIMGRAKFGKSMGLGDFAKAAALAGYNVLLVSLENSARIYSDRLDATFADTEMALLRSKKMDVNKKIKAIKLNAGILKVRDFLSSPFSPSRLRRVIEGYRSKGIVFDLIIVDYADLMVPDKITGEMREDSKQVWVDLRRIGAAENAAMVTATQTNREGAKKMTAGATDVAEDYNKTRIADLLMSGNATEAEIAANEIRLTLAASRNQKEITLQIRQDRAKMQFYKKVLSVY